MNAGRRKEIEMAKAAVEAAYEQLQNAREVLETAKDEEQEYFDNMPESLQSSEKGSNAETAVQTLEEMIDGIDEAMNTFDGFDWDTATQ